MEAVHTPVMLEECLAYLSPLGESYANDCFMVDATLGEGGHALSFLQNYQSVSLLGIDADSSIQERAKKRLAPFAGRVRFFHGWFDEFFAHYSEPRTADLVLFDLGISSYHFEKSGRGFSLNKDERLDMRLSESLERTAFDIVNTESEEALANLIFRGSDERHSRRIAHAIVAQREQKKIETTAELARLVASCVPQRRGDHIHPATRTFQALRIEVNGEIKRLKRALHTAFNAMSVGGKMAVISFHSIEDRVVKNYFRSLAKSCVCPPSATRCVCGGKPCAQILAKKPVLPSENEVGRNPPSRSAKLRVVQKIQGAPSIRAQVLEALG